MKSNKWEEILQYHIQHCDSSDKIMTILMHESVLQKLEITTFTYIFQKKFMEKLAARTKI